MREEENASEPDREGGRRKRLTRLSTWGNPRKLEMLESRVDWTNFKDFRRGVACTDGEATETLRIRRCRCFDSGCKCKVVATREGYRMARASASHLSLLFFVLFCFFSFHRYVLMLSLELSRCSSDFSLPRRPPPD